MKIIAFSDVRTTLELPNAEDTDLIILLGKIPLKMVRQIEEFYEGTPILGLLSNSCAPDLYSNTRVVHIHNRVVNCDGFRIAGFGGTPSGNSDTEGSYSEEAVKDFVEQLAVSKVDLFVSYSHLAYGDVQSALAADGFKAYSEIIIRNMTRCIIHGRLQMDFHRKMGNTNIYSVYPYKIITI